MTIDAARAAILDLLAERQPEATICPSEAARRVAAGSSPEIAADWRAAMPIVHAGVDQLLAQGAIRLRWKGQPLPARTGPYRIARAPESNPENGHSAPPARG